MQRVPETESGGRIHTSTITVAVMPEAEDVDIQIDKTTVRLTSCGASGNGGQCVNTTDSAVRLTHYPTGIVIYSQTRNPSCRIRKRHSPFSGRNCMIWNARSAMTQKLRRERARLVPETVLKRSAPTISRRDA